MTGRLTCDRHDPGSPFAVRCIDCDALAAAAVRHAPVNRWGDCSRHMGYPGGTNCLRCAEEATDAIDDPDGGTIAPLTEAEQIVFWRSQARHLERELALIRSSTRTAQRA